MFRVLLVCLLFFNVSAQQEVYYANILPRASTGPDLIRFSLYRDSVVFQTAHSFQDSITHYPIQNWHQFPISLAIPNRMSPHLLTKELDQVSLFGRTNDLRIDSIKVAGKWEQIILHYTDDNYVGGRSNQVQRTVKVPGLGLIYSHSNWFNQHDVFMLCHQDSSKHALLKAVYQHLAQTNKWQVWNKFYNLSEQYPFDSCLSELSSYWLSHLNDLKLVSYSSENTGGKINYSATIKNNSQRNYLVPKNMQVSPSQATIHYGDRTEPWNLTDTHYGTHYHALQENVYLEPGQAFTFSFSFRLYYGCGGCTAVTYSGFQLYRTPGLFDYLICGTTTHEGQDYFLYPFRTIEYVY